jgi:serine/threonine protein kinase/tetratricopeptide (TPR) repeat protein
MPALFISYRRADSPDTVKLLYERLKKALPRWEIFYDHESIPLGEQFPERLREKVASATVVLVIIGPRWLDLLRERKGAGVDHVRTEVRLALEAGPRVVPVPVGRATMPTDADLAEFADLQPLLTCNGCPVRPDPDFEGDLERIIHYLEQFEPDETIGTTLAGKYTLTAEIGHGGMGVVYRAEQKQPVQRTVAVKLIKPGMDSKQVLARFDAERQALAVMDHPHIAKVHDAGMTAQGRPFFVMEYVKGVPLTQYCDDKKLTPQERLNLFIPVCNAVQHAHQKGIIHRDLKPSNMLIEVVDGKPVPKVIDFGLAKALGHKLTDKTLFTEFGAVVGTLEYMSPEQAELNNPDIDTRADIYSLGVLLYELLTGTTPLDRAGLQQVAFTELLRHIREEEPAKPSARLAESKDTLPAIAAQRQTEPAKLTKLVRGELDWIVMKCLDKDRNRRYETANGLGRDIERYLHDEPVQAGPPSATYRLRKFVQRHRTGLLTTAAVFLVVILAASGVGWALWDRAAQEAARREELARRMAETEKAVTVALTKAQQSEERAKQLPCTTSEEAKASLAEWREAAASLAEAETALTTGAATDDLRERVADLRQRIASGRMRPQRKEGLFRDLHDARMSMANVTVTEWHLDYNSAAAKHRTAFARFGLRVVPGQTEALAQQIHGEELAVRDALIVALDSWAFCEGAPIAKDLRTTAQAADPDAWRRRCRQAVMEGDIEALVGLRMEARRRSLPPASIELLAIALGNNGRLKEALELLRWGRGLHPTDFWIAVYLGIYLGEVKPEVPVDLEERIGCFRVAVALRPDNSPAHADLGRALFAKNRLDEAIAAFNKAIALDPKSALAHHNLGRALDANKQLDDAIAEFKKAIALDPIFALAYNSLGIVLVDKNRLDDAIAEFEKAIALAPKLEAAHHNLGNALLAKKRLDDAIAAFERAIALDPNYALAYNSLGWALFAKNRLDEAIAAFNKAIALNPELAAAHCSLGSALVFKNRLDEAVTAFNKAVALDPKFAQAHLKLGAALLLQGSFAQAVVSSQRYFELSSAGDPGRETADHQIKQARRLLELDKKLHSILSGEKKPTDTAECLDLAELCRIKHFNAAAARLSKAAFAYEPTIADDLGKGYRYYAACFAGLAAAGQGNDADKLTSQERAELRKQALQWLRADLAAWDKLLDKDAGKAELVVQGIMTHWKQDTDLAGVRDPKALEKLAPDERDAWQKLWKDVDALLVKARTPRSDP